MDALRRRWMIAAVGLLSVGGCAGPGAATGDDAANAEERSVPPKPDPGPVLARQDGAVQVERRPALTATVRTRHQADGFLFVEAPLSETVESWSRPIFRRIVATGNRGLVVHRRGGSLHARLRVTGDLPKRIELVEYVRVEGMGEAPRRGWTRPIELTGIGAAPADPALEARFYAEASLWFQQEAGAAIRRQEPFYSFAASRLQALGSGATRQSRAQRPTRRRRTELGELMALYTGWTSVEEALQADRGLFIRAEEASARTIPIDSLQGVPLPSHPWPEMIAQLGRQPVLEPLASRVPQDVIYLHFSDLRVLVRTMKEIGRWASPLAQIVDGKAGATHFVERYERQLAIERLGLAEQLGHVAASSVALVAGDPFFREGTDVAILFDVRTRSLLDEAFAMYEQRARKRRPDARVSEYSVGDVRVRLLATEDREVYQHRFELDGVLIVANSRAAVERLVAVAEGKVPNLAAGGDFRYMRTRYPYDATMEHGFAFVSDALVTKVVGPRTKVLAARRMEAQADLFAVNYAALLHGWLAGEAAKSADALVGAGLLHKEELVHADGKAISLDAIRGASSGWGRVGRLVPLAELTVERVTEEEKRAYDDFVRTYQRYWRGTIDPIGMRLVRSDDGQRMHLDARMLPLIEGTDYDELTRMVGRQTIASSPAGPGLQWTLAVGQDASLRRDVDRLAGGMTGSAQIGVGWLGDWVMVGASDRSGLWDLAMWQGMIPDRRSRDALHRMGMDKMADIVSRLPLYVGAHVKNRLALAATLTALRGWVEQAAPGLVEWGPDEPYRDIPVTVVREKALPNQPPQFGLAIRYATVGDVFVAALEKETLETRIDELLDGEHVVVGARREGAPQAIVSAQTLGADSWLVRTLAGLLEAANEESLRAAYRGAEILARGLGGWPQDSAVTGVGYLSYEPRPAHGGAFSLGPNGLVTHPRHGSELEPVLPPLPVEGAPVTEVLRRLVLLEMQVAFEGEGNHRGLHAEVDWRQRARAGEGVGVRQ